MTTQTAAGLAAQAAARVGSEWMTRMIGMPKPAISAYGLAGAWLERARTGQLPDSSREFRQAAITTAETLQGEIWKALSDHDHAAVDAAYDATSSDGFGDTYLELSMRAYSPERREAVANYLRLNLPVLGRPEGDLDHLLRTQAKGGHDAERVVRALDRAWDVITGELRGQGGKVTIPGDVIRALTATGGRAPARVKGWVTDQCTKALAREPADAPAREPQQEQAERRAAAGSGTGNATAAAGPGLVAAARARLGLDVDEFASFLTEQTGLSVGPEMLSYLESEGKPPEGKVENACLDVLADKPDAHPMAQRPQDVIDIRGLLAAKHKEARPAVLQDARRQLGLTEKEFAQAVVEWERNAGNAREATDSQDIRKWENGKYPYGLSEHINTVVALMEGRQPPPPESIHLAKVIGLGDHQAAWASGPEHDSGAAEDAEAYDGFEAG